MDCQDDEAEKILRSAMSPRQFHVLEFLRYLYGTEGRGGL